MVAFENRSGAYFSCVSIWIGQAKSRSMTTKPVAKTWDGKVHLARLTNGSGHFPQIHDPASFLVWLNRHAAVHRCGQPGREVLVLLGITLS